MLLFCSTMHFASGVLLGCFFKYAAKLLVCATKTLSFPKNFIVPEGAAVKLAEVLNNQRIDLQHTRYAYDF